MKPVRTPETNHGWGAPAGRDDTIGLLPVQVVDEEHGSVHYSTWELTDHERAAIAEGANLRLGVTWIGGMPPVSLSVTSATRENGGILE